MVTTRKRAAKTDQSGDDNKDQPKTDDTKAKKRKRQESSSADKTDEEVGIETKHAASKARLEVDKEEQENHINQKSEQSAPVEPVVCSCRHDVMRCIGILPSLPIMDEYYDSDDSESDFEESRHTVLPIVDRSATKQQQQHDH